MIFDLLILITAIIIHELGHYIAFRIAGVKPSIKIRWWGILIGENDLDTLSVRQYIGVNIAGVFTGLLFLSFIVSEKPLVLIYLVACSIDISNIIQTLDIKKEDRRLTVGELQLKQAKEIITKNGYYYD